MTAQEAYRPSHRAILNAAAGAAAGAIARVAVGPLDVLKIRFQVQIEPICKGASTAALPGQIASKYTGIGQALKTILKEEGIQGLWRGTVPGLLLTVPYTAVQFVTLQQCKHFAHQHGLEERWGSSVSFLSGAVAGAAATIASYPFDLLRTTLAAQGEPKVYHSMTQAAVAIAREQGIHRLYTGMGVTLLEIMPYAALQFGTYDLFTSAYSRARRKALVAQGHTLEDGDGHSHFDHFLCGLAAGTIAKLGTHPLDVCKKRFQVAGLQRSIKYGARVPPSVVKSLPQCLRQIYTHEGVRGLYKGALPSIIKAAPMAAITFTTYEFLIGYLMAHFADKGQHKQSRPLH
ncbi:hypothetical protein WJX72_004133 [[Myrmecia] bisecta]|uniref:Mitochondrial thiamine pyrophosphate carrier n=1 Tax=[Myrmecia] bisecta TaxID=41462 RepID=A0AAW1Q6H6_9CHLO